MSDAKRPFDKSMASGLWNGVKVIVEHFHTKLDRRSKVDFLGFARVTLDASAVLPGLILTLTGLQVKLLKGEPRIDFKQEKGSDNKWYDLFYARTAELRTVITMRIFQDARVQAAIEAVKALPAAGFTPDEQPANDDPFASN